MLYLFERKQHSRQNNKHSTVSHTQGPPDAHCATLSCHSSRLGHQADLNGVPGLPSSRRSWAVLSHLEEPDHRFPLTLPSGASPVESVQNISNGCAYSDHVLELQDVSSALYFVW